MRRFESARRLQQRVRKALGALSSGAFFMPAPCGPVRSVSLTACFWRGPPRASVRAGTAGIGGPSRGSLAKGPCPHCQGTLTPEGGVGTPVPHRVHAVEYAHRVIPHDRHWVRCAHGGSTILAELPPAVAGSQYGPALAALGAVFSGVFQLARREVVHLCRERFAVPISGGSVQRLCQEASAAVAKPVAALAEAIRAEPVVGIDETGWRHRGKRGWLWAVWSRIGTRYRVADTRSGRIGREMLGPQYPGHVPRPLQRPQLDTGPAAPTVLVTPAARYPGGDRARQPRRPLRQGIARCGPVDPPRLTQLQSSRGDASGTAGDAADAGPGPATPARHPGAGLSWPRSQNSQAVRLPVRQLAFAVGLPDGGWRGAHQQRHRARHAPSGPLAAQELGNPERRGCPLRRTDAHSQCDYTPPGPFAPHLRAGCPGCRPPGAAYPVAAAIRSPARTRAPGACRTPRCPAAIFGIRIGSGTATHIRWARSLPRPGRRLSIALTPATVHQLPQTGRPPLRPARHSACRPALIAMTPPLLPPLNAYAVASSCSPYPEDPEPGTGPNVDFRGKQRGTIVAQMGTLMLQRWQNAFRINSLVLSLLFHFTSRLRGNRRQGHHAITRFRPPHKIHTHRAAAL